MDDGRKSKALEPCREENNQIINVLMKFYFPLTHTKIKEKMELEKKFVISD